jgi:hypothetical protein
MLDAWQLVTDSWHGSIVTDSNDYEMERLEQRMKTNKAK